ncbi:MAG: sensor histidine kinase [Planctomyces sp.]|nr:sensor histidine kinase [Planctomyces sp.]
MTVKTKSIRAEQHVELSEILREDAREIADAWANRSRDEQPQAARLHHVALLDHVPHLLEALSVALADHSLEVPHKRPARQHGEQRWEHGWSLEEVVQDYQILRLVLVDHLERAAARPLESRELMALGLALDDAIAASVRAYVRESAAQMRQQTEALQLHASRLEELNSQKNEFLAVLGHELRNPLAPVRNALDLLALEGAKPDVFEWAQGVLNRQVSLMIRLVDDLLDFSRIAQGKIALNARPLDFGQLVRQAGADAAPDFDKAGIALETRVPEAPVMLPGDSQRLMQVVSNLLNNARKFTGRGGRVTIELHADAGCGEARLCVRDTGIGIERELLSRVFETFTQGRQSQEQGRTGLGLGLALVRQLVGLHGGSVHAESDGPGQGSAFFVTLPSGDAQTGG